MTMNGTLIRKTEPHQKCSTRKPLSTGPSAIPLMVALVQTATAVRRCFSSWNMLRISASVEGISVAPATPWTARAVISSAALCEYAAPSDARLNARAPASSSRRRPIRSPSDPMVMSSPASTKPYTSKIHSCCAPLGCRSRLMNGTAK